MSFVTLMKSGLPSSQGFALMAFLVLFFAMFVAVVKLTHAFPRAAWPCIGLFCVLSITGGLLALSYGSGA
jgi:uncharacterized integral membrane protein